MGPTNHWLINEFCGALSYALLSYFYWEIHKPPEKKFLPSHFEKLKQLLIVLLLCKNAKRVNIFYFRLKEIPARLLLRKVIFLSLIPFAAFRELFYLKLMFASLRSAP